MAFEALISKLVPEGSVLSGNAPNIIDTEGNMRAPNYQSTGFSALARHLQERSIQFKMAEEKQAEEQKKRFDMYKTLRDSGYDPARAHKAVTELSFPREAGGLTAEENVKGAQVDKEKALTAKAQAETEKIKAQTGVISSNNKKLTERILEKVADGTELTPGEQKVYDEYIRKYGEKSSVEDIMNKKLNAGEDVSTSNYVAMIDPQGNNKKVHPDDVAKAIKKGWKKR